MSRKGASMRPWPNQQQNLNVRVSSNKVTSDCDCLNKKHLKNVGTIRHCEPPHAHSPGVATGTVARRLRIDVHDDNDDNDNA